MVITKINSRTDYELQWRVASFTTLYFCFSTGKIQLQTLVDLFIISDDNKKIVCKNTNDWYIKWQRMTTSGTTNDSEWQQIVQQVTTSGITRNNEWQRSTTSGNEWQRVTTSDNEWHRVVQRMTTSGTTLRIEILSSPPFEIWSEAHAPPPHPNPSPIKKGGCTLW